MPTKELNDSSFLTHPNLVAYWRLENVNSTVGSFNLTNTGSGSFNAALFGNGFDTDNVSSTTKYLSIGNNLGIGSGNFTMNIWFKHNGTTKAGNFPHIFTIGNSSVSLYHQIGSDGSSIMFRSRGFNSATGITITETHAPSQSVFEMYSMTFDGTTLRAYINGVEVGNGTGARSGSGGTNNTVFMVYLGDGGINSADGRIGGIIDDASVFSAALSDVEIAQLYEERVSGALFFGM